MNKINTTFDSNSNKIKIRLSSFDYTLVDKSIKEIIYAARKTGAQVKGPVMLPTKIRRITVLKSPHINKTAMDQFEIRNHRRLIYIIEPNAKTVDELIKLDLASGVHVQIK